MVSSVNGMAQRAAEWADRARLLEGVPPEALLTWEVGTDCICRRGGRAARWAGERQGQLAPLWHAVDSPWLWMHH